MSIKRAATSSVTKSGSAISDVPDAPTVGTPTDSGDGTTASVSFTAAVTGGGSISSYTVTSSPGGFTGTGASSPISVTGLTAGTAYTFTVTATNSSGTSPASSASSSLTLASVGNYFLIERASGTGSSDTITFSSIPQTYKHLQLRILAKGTSSGSAGANDLYMTFNGDSGTNYRGHWLYGNGSSAGSQDEGASAYVRIERAINTSYTGLTYMMGVAIVDILDYSLTTKYKVNRNLCGIDTNNVGSGYVGLSSGLWMSTSAISSITVKSTGTTNFTTSSTIALYGVS